MLTKTLNPYEATEKDFSTINTYARKKLDPSEVYTFSMILCGNDIDRDGEAFTKESLTKMAKLFQGITGVFDHNASSKNQISRIYKTSLVKTNTKTLYGDDKYLLKAWAYMLKNDFTKDLISKIDAGIIKEISVSCNVEKKLCSICNSIYDGSCNHMLGKKYDNSLCYIKLVNPFDAYEWSFVAVPAQLDAKVVKHFNTSSKNNSEFSKKASIGLYYENKLKAQVVKLSFLNNFMQDNDSFKDIINKLSIKELEAFKLELSKNLKNKNFTPSLPVPFKKTKTHNLEFVV